MVRFFLVSWLLPLKVARWLSKAGHPTQAPPLLPCGLACGT